MPPDVFIVPHGPIKMLDCKKLAALTLALSLLAPPARLAARTRKGDKLISQGKAAEVRKQWDQALKNFVEKWEGKRRIEVNGPWPPYSFVSDAD